MITASPNKEGITQVKRKNIQHGRLVKDLVEVTSGIDENEWVVIEGQHYISDASEVYVINKDDVKLAE